MHRLNRGLLTVVLLPLLCVSCAQTFAGGRLEAVGYGETKPVVANTTPTNREMNRRVEFVVVDSQ